MLRYLFVYGTLRKTQDGRLHPYLKKRAVFIDHASLPGKLYQIGCYPGAVPEPAASGFRVHGEVYRLLDPARLLPILDEYEECTGHFPQPHEYRRVSASVTLADGWPLKAWVYWFRHSTAGLRQISSGDYLDYRNRNES
ncbi:gamma-glutamylcyclotransferase [Methylomonas sp. LL1]|uniref:gamma-glutamylcyclotransferase family protein n=1 Tax=Methylomonas sp. LL1 TaxID=2785785 RepID=UPI0018C3BF4A|nr:gamma-glutamylcyclotransferase family protein [Methylomonas sp. LL1]QPK64719.1 gamma-glutamylcyclotransferase [Methylomonas sp. LL1]